MKIITIVGARPQFIKAAIVSLAFQARDDGSSNFVHQILHTGQHYDYEMNAVFFQELTIPEPDYFLGISSGKHGEMTGKMLAGIEQILVQERPDRVVVYGDTNSTLAGALAAAKLHIPVAHVEAGLRSFNRAMPEEINRVVADHVADLLFCPTPTAVGHLRDEGIERQVLHVGDVMFDAFLHYRDMASEKSGILQRLGLLEGQYSLATVHRQENTDDPTRLHRIFKALVELAKMGHIIVLPLHPRTEKALQHCPSIRMEHPNLRILPPAGYLDFVALEARAGTILTDSGGIQKEAFFAGVPCITLREETEWVETLEAGWNVLAGADTDRIIRSFQEGNPVERSLDAKPFGQGNAGALIVEHLLHPHDTSRQVERCTATG
jgi:UDP-N-acetylglucosamine 2-epimerase